MSDPITITADQGDNRHWDWLYPRWKPIAYRTKKVILDVCRTGAGAQAESVTHLTYRVSIAQILLIQNDHPYNTGTVWDRGDGTFWLIEASSSPHDSEPPIGLPIHPPSAAEPGDWLIELDVKS